MKVFTLCFISQQPQDVASHSEFTFTPDCGVLGPQETKQVEVLFKASDAPRRVRTALQCNVKNGKTRYRIDFSLYYRCVSFRLFAIFPHLYFVGRFRWMRVMVAVDGRGPRSRFVDAVEVAAIEEFLGFL